MRLSAGHRGFTLIEAVIAVAIVALGCLAVSGVLHVSLRAEAAETRRQAEREALDEEAARLRALPYFRAEAAPGAGPPSLLAEVFPHARTAFNTGSSVFDASSDRALFVTFGIVSGLRVRRVAGLCRDVAGALVPLTAADLTDWAVWDAAEPPALVVVVTLEVPGRQGAGAARRLVVHALPVRAERAQA
jgi:prepilin-type N-terminal cleavage/methylation domain-containing protein